MKKHVFWVKLIIFALCAQHVQLAVGYDDISLSWSDLIKSSAKSTASWSYNEIACPIGRGVKTASIATAKGMAAITAGLSVPVVAGIGAGSLSGMIASRFLQSDCAKVSAIAVALLTSGWLLKEYGRLIADGTYSTLSGKSLKARYENELKELGKNWKNSLDYIRQQVDVLNNLSPRSSSNNGSNNIVLNISNQNALVGSNSAQNTHAIKDQANIIATKFNAFYEFSKQRYNEVESFGEYDEGAIDSNLKFQCKKGWSHLLFSHFSPTYSELTLNSSFFSFSSTKRDKLLGLRIRAAAVKKAIEDNSSNLRFVNELSDSVDSAIGILKKHIDELEWYAYKLKRAQQVAGYFKI